MSIRPRFRIAITYNGRTADDEEQAELLRPDYVEGVREALASLGHEARLVEVSGTPAQIAKRLGAIDPDLVFNLAEGHEGAWREAFYPMLYQLMGLPYTGAGPGILGLGLDKRLTEELLRLKGVDTPKGRVVTQGQPAVPDDLRYPVFIKPNFEGSSMGIHQDSVAEDEQEAQARIDAIIDDYPGGLDVEEYIPGRELQIGYLAENEDPFTAIVEYRFPEGRRNIMDYETKMAAGDDVETLCPAPLTPEERAAVRTCAARTVSALRLPDFGRLDIRLDDEGRAFLIEINPLAGLRKVSPFVIGAMEQGLSYAEIMGLIVRSAARRYGLTGEVAPEVVS